MLFVEFHTQKNEMLTLKKKGIIATSISESKRILFCDVKETASMFALSQISIIFS